VLSYSAAYSAVLGATTIGFCERCYPTLQPTMQPTLQIFVAARGFCECMVMYSPEPYYVGFDTAGGISSHAPISTAILRSHHSSFNQKYLPHVHKNEQNWHHKLIDTKLKVAQDRSSGW